MSRPRFGRARALAGLPLALLCSAAAAAPVFLEIRTDPRFELLAMVQLLARAERTSAAFFRHDIPYDRAAQAHFGAYARHPVVEAYERLSRAGFDYIQMYHFVFALTNPPELEIADARLSSALIRRAGGAQALNEFRLLLADFARVSRFQSFYDEQAAERARLVELVAAQARSVDLEDVFERYTGLPVPARYTVILSPFAEPVMSVNFTTTDPDGVPRLTCLYGPEERRGVLRFRFETRFAGLWEELANLSLKSAARPFAARLENSAALYAPVAGACAADWYECAQRQIAFAVGARLLHRQGSAEMAALWPVKYARIGMPHLAPLVERLKEYEARRDRYATIMDFYPRLLDAFEELASRRAKAPPFLGGFDESWRGAGPAVLIAPSGGAAVLRGLVEALLARRPSAELMSDARALAADLSGKTLIVVGAARDNRWLARRYGELHLPARVEEERIRFNPRPGEDAGLVLPGRLGYVTTALNPDDESRPVLLYTGANADAVRDAAGFDPGSADYAVLLGTSPLKVGIYEKSRLPWRLK